MTFTTEHRNQKLSAGIPENQNVDYDFLTIYDMSDLAFRETQTFKYVRELPSSVKTHDIC